MKTVDEAAVDVFKRDDPVFSQSLQELLEEPRLLSISLSIADWEGGNATKVLKALCLGVLIGMETERQS